MSDTTTLSSAVREEWRRTLGAHWPLVLASLVLALFIAGASLPLAEPDLPVHLATGDWILAHGAVPLVEPFAWTRAGAPFYAYSWAAEVLYVVVLRAAGPWGLHVLLGLVVVAVAASVIVLGRVARWSVWTTLVIAALNVIAAFGITPFLRPQQFLFIGVPLVWAFTMRARDAERPWPALAGLLLVGAMLANTHLLYPISAASWVVLLTTPPRERWRVLAIPIVLVAGWMLSPYAAHALDVLQLNGAQNAMFGPPSTIAEHQPGFAAAITTRAFPLYLGVALAFLPFAVADRYSPMERLLWGVAWLAGLTLFGLAVRGLAVWWLITIPMTAAAVERLQLTNSNRVLLAQRFLFVTLVWLLALGNVQWLFDADLLEGGADTRILPSPTARPVEPIAAWLDCHLRPEAHGRVVTVFNLGSYIPWRLPRLSASVDGRTIFPDSVALAETFIKPNRRTPPLPPWRSADLAIAPTNRLVAAVLDTASGWRRVAVSAARDASPTPTAVTLWVRESWWETAGKGALPDTPLVLHERNRSDPNPACTN